MMAKAGAALGIFLVSALLFGDCIGAAQEQDARVITIGTGAVTGIYFPLGGAICRLVNREHRTHGIRCLVDSTDGSIDNLNAIRHGELDLGLAQSDQQSNAYRGLGPFAAEGPDKNLRTLFSLHPEPFTVVARADSGIKTFADLKGKRVNIGPQGSGQRATLEALLAAKGWTLADFAEVSQLPPGQQAEALCDNKVDAIVYTVGHPNRSILESTIACDSVFVEVAGSAVDRLVRDNAYYTHAVIPGGMYRGNPHDVATFGVKSTLVSSADIAEETIYQVVKAVFENFAEFQSAHVALATQTRQSMVSEGNSAPLHKGAERYYKEAGLLDQAAEP